MNFNLTFLYTIHRYHVNKQRLNILQILFVKGKCQGYQTHPHRGATSASRLPSKGQM